MASPGMCSLVPSCSGPIFGVVASVLDCSWSPLAQLIHTQDTPIHSCYQLIDRSLFAKRMQNPFVPHVVAEFAQLDPGDMIAMENYRGAFGILTHNNSCHFRDAKVYLFAMGN